jgi:two-component system cell cycle sensor histidine kinase/response regulator CckA
MGISFDEANERYRVLCADDEPAILTTLGALLRKVGFGVETAPDGVSAWKRLQSDPTGFDLLITDNEMPGLSGLGLAERIRAAGMRTKVVVFSGSVTNAQAERMARIGCHAVVEKGAGAERLMEIIAGILRPP